VASSRQPGSVLFYFSFPVCVRHVRLYRQSGMRVRSGGSTRRCWLLVVHQKIASTISRDPYPPAACSFLCMQGTHARDLPSILNFLSVSGRRGLCDCQISHRWIFMVGQPSYLTLQQKIPALLLYRSEAALLCLFRGRMTKRNDMVVWAGVNVFGLVKNRC
jgi:hypothetical protein